MKIAGVNETVLSMSKSSTKEKTSEEERQEIAVNTTELPGSLSLSEVFQIKWEINITELDSVTCRTQRFPNYPISDRFYVKVKKDTSEECSRLIVQVFKCGEVDQKLEGDLLCEFRPSVVLYDDQQEVEVKFGANSQAEVVMSPEWQEQFLKDGVLRMGCSVSVPRPQEAAALGSLSELNSIKQLTRELWNITSFDDCLVYYQEGGSIPALKAVLCARSPVFKQLIEKDTEVKLPLEIGESSALVEFVYLGQCHPKYLTEKMLTAAEQFKMPDLKLKVELHLAKSISQDNVLKYLTLAVKADASHLLSACLDYIKRHDLTDAIRLQCEKC